MSKKHFIKLAAMVASLRESYGENIPASALVGELVGVCADANPNFDARRFAAACAPEPVAAVVIPGHLPATHPRRLAMLAAGAIAA
jgi:hypothetical protein